MLATVDKRAAVGLFLDSLIVVGYIDTEVGSVDIPVDYSVMPTS